MKERKNKIIIGETKENKNYEEVVKMKKYEGYYDVEVEKFQKVFPDTFEALVEMFEGYVKDETNSTYPEDFEEWLNEGWVHMYVIDGEVQYIPEWVSKRYKGDDLPWLYDEVSDVEEELEALKVYRQEF